MEDFLSVKLVKFEKTTYPCIEEFICEPLAKLILEYMGKFSISIGNTSIYFSSWGDLYYLMGFIVMKVKKI